MEGQSINEKNSSVLNINAKKSEKPFLVMIIVGASILTIAFILYLVGIVVLSKTIVELLGPLDGTIPFEDLDFSSPGIITAVILFVVSVVFLISGIALLGVGIPKFVITRKRKNRTLSESNQAK